MQLWRNEYSALWWVAFNTATNWMSNLCIWIRKMCQKVLAHSTNQSSLVPSVGSKVGINSLPRNGIVQPSTLNLWKGVVWAEDEYRFLSLRLHVFGFLSCSKRFQISQLNCMALAGNFIFRFGVQVFISSPSWCFIQYTDWALDRPRDVSRPQHWGTNVCVVFRQCQ